MAALKLYLSQNMLILAFTCLFWLVSSVPVTKKVGVNCTLYAQKMLYVIQETCTENNTVGQHNGFCLGGQIDKNLEPELNPTTQTAAVCSPKGSTCSGDTRSEFNKELCLHNVEQDLVYYRNVLSDVVDNSRKLEETNELRTAIGTSLLQSVKSVMESCALTLSELPTKTAVVKPRPENSFKEREILAKMLRGFEVRATTITRALCHIYSAQ